jgi:hypothetical protein
MKVTAVVFLALAPLLSLAVPITKPTVALADRDTGLSFEDILHAEFAGTPTTPLQARATLTDTENGLTTDACKALTFIFARMSPFAYFISLSYPQVRIISCKY